MDEKEMIDEAYSWFEQKTEQSKVYFISSSKEQLIQYHTTLGRAIRNHFKLWELDWKPQYKMKGSVEYDVSPDHPDAISMRIIEAVWERAKEEYIWIK